MFVYHDFTISQVDTRIRIVDGERLLYRACIVALTSNRSGSRSWLDIVRCSDVVVAIVLQRAIALQRHCCLRDDGMAGLVVVSDCHCSTSDVLGMDRQRTVLIVSLIVRSTDIAGIDLIRACLRPLADLLFEEHLSLTGQHVHRLVVHKTLVADDGRQRCIFTIRLFGIADANVQFDLRDKERQRYPTVVGTR